MTKSMTGYGSATFENEAVYVQIELKTLNSKFLDIATKIPKEFFAFENEIKKKISEQLQRGKINFSIELSQKSTTQSAGIINANLFEHYKNELRTVSEGLKLSDADLFHNILKMPEIMISRQENVDLITKKQLFELLDNALGQCNQFRIQEGRTIEEVIEKFTKSISNHLTEIKLLDPNRIQNIKARLHENVREVVQTNQIDTNRFEQELIYYIEKIDIAEETIRLDNHIVYFLETLKQPESQGKKMGFISQEMGREINTIGSKANNSSIQKFVVEMKDELEKIKEQILNII